MSLGQDQARGSKNSFSGNSEKVVIMGAGPAGLSAAYQLVKKGYRPTVLEKADKPGGISRTEEYKGFRFDIGGHRFLTEMAEIQEIWEGFLGDDFIRTARRSSIRYGDRVYRYPLDFSDLLKNLDVMEALSVTASYVLARLNPSKREKNLEEWMINRFGTRLYGTFFKPYTEKLWGLPCSKIQVEWAIQRIGRLSLRKAVLHSLSGKNPVRTQMNHFYYPVSGPGQLWWKMSQWIGEKGGELRYASSVFQVNHAKGKITSIDMNDGRGGSEKIIGDHFISTIPLSALIRAMKPPPEPDVVNAANGLNHRDMIIVNLIIDRPDLFPDQWLYIHNPGIRTGRIQNFKNWS